MWLPAPAQDNVLLIIADDFGVDYMATYGMGSDFAPTPVLDSLAGEGVVFTNAWTNPICSPSRANILAGKYAFRTGIGTAITGPDNVRLDTAEYTVAKAVKAQAGAATAMMGKWHLGHNSQAFRRNPNACGFDRYAGNVEGQISNYYAWTKTVNGANSVVLNYATTEAVNDAINWLGGRDEPWFLVMSFNAPHVPFHKPPNDLHSFDYLSTSQSEIDANPIPYFKAMVEAMDTEIGRLIAYLKNSGQLASTNIVFIGDNGTDDLVVQAPFNPAKAKGTVYEGGVRVPLIVSGPSVVQPGRTSAELINSTDLYHTVLELMGGDPGNLPAGSAPDSRSFLPVLQNSPDTGSRRAWIYGDLFRPLSSGPSDGKAISDGEYKLIRFDQTGAQEFYHIAADPFEASPIDIYSLNAVQQDHYDFLCSELSALLSAEYCELPTGIGLAGLLPVGLYPNPAREYLIADFGASPVAVSGAFTVQIYDAAGTQVRAFGPVSAGRVEVPLSGLAPGSYSLVFSRGGTAVAGAPFIRQ